MKAITVRQPWAQAIVDGHKLIENRRLGFPHRYRGRVAIHAGAAWSRRGLTDPRIEAVYGYAAPPGASGEYERMPLGAIIGIATLADAHPVEGGCCAPWGEQVYESADGVRVADIVHLMLEDPIRLAEPIPFQGRLGLWRLPDDLRL